MTLATLSRRRREVALLVGLNYSCREIAAELNMSIHTVHSHVQWVAGQLENPRNIPAMRLVRGWVIAHDSAARTCHVEPLISSC